MGRDRYAKYAPFVIRLGLGLVLLWFGMDELRNPATWSSLVPNGLANLFGSAGAFMQLNGAFEILLAVLFFLGFYTRVVAAVTALHFLGIMLSLGYGDLAVRDLGLLMAAVSLVFSGAGLYNLTGNIRTFKRMFK